MPLYNRGLMSRPLRIAYPGAVYHVTSRGNARAEIFRNDSERLDFYEILEAVVRDYNWICHADCQMGNHYHLCVETPEANLAAGMRQLNSLITQKLNRKRGTVGHVFQGRYAAQLIEKEAYFLEVVRYIVLNPVRAGLVAKAADWRWSSYRATAGIRTPLPFQTTGEILARFGTERAAAAAAYRQFVAAGVGAESPFSKMTGGILGQEDFVKQVMAPVRVVMESSASGGLEVARAERLAGRPGLAELKTGIAYNKKRRDEAVRAAWNLHGYLMTEIGRAFNLHYTTVSKIVREN